MDFFDSDCPDDSAIRAEKNKARELRRSRWWQQKSASGNCHYCGKHVGCKALTMDHLVPLARGGRSTKQNLVPSCKTCNNLKKSMMPIEWQEYLEKRGEEAEGKS